ncbi:GGDEF domain-containing protein [Dyella monticola]|uniref:diguanylate cyclase n=1 Tax=Dyella monticola TaxID=1927958 RepID=A0A370X618_9GAMM|nr:GGDEF domain-containing protein [Dyella monticola]RDS83691.1 GGDEF domain-containing protein [Dyella monticola]
MSAVSVAIATTWLLGLLMLPLLGSLLRSGVPGVRQWLDADVLLIIAMPLLLLRGRIPDFISIVVANVLIALAGVTLYAGFARFMHRPARWPRLFACVAIMALGATYWRYGVDSIPMRVVLSTGFTAAVCVAIAVVVARYRSAGRAPYLYAATTGVALIFAACQILRGSYFLSVNHVSNALTFDTTANVVLLCVGAAIMPVLLMCGMMMVHDTLLSEARDAVNRDFLTGALSREGFTSVARTLLAEADHNDAPLACLLVDLDHFKSINDTFGHTGGDQVLREFVALMRTVLRTSDALARIGGEEFAILMPDIALDRAQSLAEQLRNAATRHAVVIDGGTCTYSLSGGLAMRLPGETLDQLTVRADRALYQAKISGRNRLCIDERSPSRDA